ncbi:hypothetical protein LTR37_013011 [Vermiconidia calcicola]|uniref:Uncharacterized protein n=1 Tax=Vermiconidia calcicola TaxID=1690605 RepID=A0ACC3MZC0_9PEZI|nr:hypothetical protein LTR37_013011 [Vermiconidia calcicola]
MRLLHASNFVFKEFMGDGIPSYLIISHRWSDEEVSHQDFLDGRKAFLKGRCSGYGWVKIAKACRLDLKANLEWVWIDTCCIDKKSSAELSEAINSMFKWYEDSTECLVFLPDVGPIKERPAILPTASDERMQWASSREATRVEDLAYSLLGLFGINMPLLYGEGERAFLRLQKELIAISDDGTIFTATSTTKDCHEARSIIAHNPSQFVNTPIMHPVDYIPRLHYEMTNKGIRFEVQISKKKHLALLGQQSEGRLGFDIIMPLDCFVAEFDQFQAVFPQWRVAINIRIANNAYWSNFGSSIAYDQSLRRLRGRTYNDLFYGYRTDEKPRDSIRACDMHSLTWCSRTTGKKADADLVIGVLDGSEMACQVYVD